MSDKMDLPRVLIISNNVVSDTKNNGKTIHSFFKNYPSEKIRQLYFSNELPTGRIYSGYYRISDMDMLKLKSGDIITNASKKPIVRNNLKVNKNQYNRIIREIVWKSNRWKNKKLIKWLDDFKPEIVFFVAGDSGFAYDITRFIMEKYKTKLITYVTDDYILPRSSENKIIKRRRLYIKSKLSSILHDTDIFVTISEKMRNTYLNIFNKDSYIASNQVISLKREIASKSSKHTRLLMVYAGGLHFKRYETIALLSNVINNLNKKMTVKLELEIYTNSYPSEKVLKMIENKEDSKYKGTLSNEELILKLNEADILLHVESFEKECIESTKLSVSTKINEYISVEKPILAIGPEGVASMEYLKEVAICITHIDDLEKNITDLYCNNSVLKEYALKSRKKKDENSKNNFSDILPVLIKKICL